MSWGTHIYTLIDRIEEIESDMEIEKWQSALALALTIPDICGQVEFSHIVVKRRDGTTKRNVGEQYRQWFSKYVEPYYADESGWNNEFKAIKPFFTAEMCYQLRNSFLHSGSDDCELIEYCFSLHINSSDSYHAGNHDNGIHASIDIKLLCERICTSARKFYSKWSNKKDFEDRQCEWVDISEWHKFYTKSNDGNRNGEE